MEELYNKLTQLRDLIKALNMPKGPTISKLPEIKPIPTPSINPAPTTASKMPGIAPKNKKDPKKVAQQLKSGKTQNQPMLKFNEGGQWSLDKVEEKPLKKPFGNVTVIPDSVPSIGTVKVIPNKK